jgi:hypothetical protein
LARAAPPGKGDTFGGFEQAKTPQSLINKSASFGTEFRATAIPRYFAIINALVVARLIAQALFASFDRFGYPTLRGWRLLPGVLGVAIDRGYHQNNSSQCVDESLAHGTKT